MGKTEACGPILVVDDDRNLRQLVRELLEQRGYRVLEAENGREGLELAERERPELVILDVALPSLSGYEVCRALRERFNGDVPVVFLSGERSEPHDRVAGLLLGADDYMTKPFAADELLARVRAVLRRSRPTRANAGLTPREHEVLQLLAEGLEQLQIAERLVISPKTVGTHIERILSKLGVRSRAQAVAVAYRDRLLPDPSLTT
jgi:DNA-binding response OmpR family regulator